MIKGLGDLMQQAQKMQADMQERMEKVQKELTDLRVTGESGAGMVKVQMTCKYDVRRVSIDESVMDDREMLNLQSETGDWHHDRRRISRSDLIGIMRPRVEEKYCT